MVCQRNGIRFENTIKMRGFLGVKMRAIRNTFGFDFTFAESCQGFICNCLLIRRLNGLMQPFQG